MPPELYTGSPTWRSLDLSPLWGLQQGGTDPDCGDSTTVGSSEANPTPDKLRVSIAPPRFRYDHLVSIDRTHR